MIFRGPVDAPAHTGAQRTVGNASPPRSSPRRRARCPPRARSCRRDSHPGPTEASRPQSSAPPFVFAAARGHRSATRRSRVLRSSPPFVLISTPPAGSNDAPSSNRICTEASFSSSLSITAPSARRSPDSRASGSCCTSKKNGVSAGSDSALSVGAAAQNGARRAVWIERVLPGQKPPRPTRRNGRSASVSGSGRAALP